MSHGLDVVGFVVVDAEQVLEVGRLLAGLESLHKLAVSLVRLAYRVCSLGLGLHSVVFFKLFQGVV